MLKKYNTFRYKNFFSTVDENHYFKDKFYILNAKTHGWFHFYNIKNDMTTSKGYYNMNEKYSHWLESKDLKYYL